MPKKKQSYFFKMLLVIFSFKTDNYFIPTYEFAFNIIGILLNQLQ